MQFLSKEYGIVAGKLYTLTGDDNAFAHNYRTTFMNTGLDFNLTLALVPFSAFGGGFVVLPWEGAQFTVSVIDPSGSPTSNDLGDAFKDGVLLGGEGRMAIKPFGLEGHQLVGFIWSMTKDDELDAGIRRGNDPAIDKAVMAGFTVRW